jgi:hypothetical protein
MTKTLTSFGTHPLVRAGRWHADVGDDHVRCQLGGEAEQVAVVMGEPHDLHVRLVVEERPDPFADQQAIVRDHEPDDPHLS